jgi:hypothetical protein
MDYVHASLELHDYSGDNNSSKKGLGFRIRAPIAAGTVLLRSHAVALAPHRRAVPIRAPWSSSAPPATKPTKPTLIRSSTTDLLLAVASAVYTSERAFNAVTALYPSAAQIATDLPLLLEEHVQLCACVVAGRDAGACGDAARHDADDEHSVLGMSIRMFAALQQVHSDATTTAALQQDSWTPPPLSRAAANRLRYICRYNSHALTDGDGGQALFATLSRLNHSCWPNACVATATSTETVATVRAMCAIDALDEVCIAYVSLDVSRRARRRQLNTWHDMECECTRCAAFDADVDNDGSGDGGGGSEVRAKVVVSSRTPLRAGVGCDDVEDAWLPNDEALEAAERTTGGSGDTNDLRQQLQAGDEAETAPALTLRDAWRRFSAAQRQIMTRGDALKASQATHALATLHRWCGVHLHASNRLSRAVVETLALAAARRRHWSAALYFGCAHVAAMRVLLPPRHPAVAAVLINLVVVHAHAVGSIADGSESAGKSGSGTCAGKSGSGTCANGIGSNDADCGDDDATIAWVLTHLAALTTSPLFAEALLIHTTCYGGGVAALVKCYFSPLADALKTAGYN